MSNTTALQRRSIVAMGVSASGKSTVGAGLAKMLRIPFVDGDDLHPQNNIEKMKRGEPLTDEDRAPWLDAVGAVLADAKRYPLGVVVACSALKRAYRDRIRAVAAPLSFVYLNADRTLIERRFAERHGHFMPSALIESQFAALEIPQQDEQDVVSIDAHLSLNDMLALAVMSVGGN
jgi:gluconokinase